MIQLVPFLSENKQSTVKNEVASASHLTIKFDSTFRLGEALAIVFRYVDCGFEIHQCLVRFCLIEEHSWVKSWAGVSTQLQVPSSK